MEKDLKKYIIEPQTVAVLYDDELAIQDANEYTVRNLLLAAKRGEIEREKIKIISFPINTENETLTHTVNESFKIVPKFECNFFSLSYDLAFELLP